jgi:hypothetical protein
MLGYRVERSCEKYLGPNSPEHLRPKHQVYLQNHIKENTSLVEANVLGKEGLNTVFI